MIYIDEAHFHRDMDLGYVWAKSGQHAWRASDCLGLSERINRFGAYDFTRGRCLIWNEGPCNGASTKTLLQRLQEWIGPTSAKIVIVWDGAPWHRAKIATAQAKALGMEPHPLPGYSPDLNPIEGLWKGMREEVTRGYCQGSMRELFEACKAFVERIHQNPIALVDRLRPQFELDPEKEKLLSST